MEKAEASFQEFKNLYQNSSGVMEMLIDDFLGDTLMVWVDTSFFKEDSIPKLFNGIRVNIIPAYEELNAYESLIDNLGNRDLADKYFGKSAKYLKNIIKRYEERL